MAKIRSMTKLPVSSPAMVGPSTVTTGISALRSACLATTANSVRPLARAVRM